MSRIQTINERLTLYYNFMSDCPQDLASSQQWVVQPRIVWIWGKPTQVLPVNQIRKAKKGEFITITRPFKPDVMLYQE